MKKHIRYIALFLSLLFLVCTPLFGCAEKEEVIGTVGEYEILYDELRFITMSYKTILDKTYGDGIDDNGTIWDDPVLAERYRAELEGKVMTMLRQNYSVLIACEKYGIGRDVMESSEMKKKVDLQYEQAYKSVGTKADFRRELEAQYMTERLYRLYLTRELMKYELRTAVLTSDEKSEISDVDAFHAWLREGNCVYVQHIFLRNDEKDAVEANRMIASEVSAILQTGEYTIDKFVGDEKFNEDLTNVSPYFLIDGMYDKALCDAGLRLMYVGDATDAVETDEGFYVLQRIEEPEGLLEEQINDLYDTYLWTTIGNGVVDGEEIPVVFNEYGKGIDLVTME